MNKLIDQMRWKQLLVIPVALLLTVSVTSCRVEQTNEGELPDVDVDAEAGELPAYDVDGPEVDVSTEEKTIEVPTVDVEPPSEDAE